MASEHIAFDLGGTAIKGALLRSDGTIVERLRRPTRGKDGPEAVLGDITAAYKELAGKADNLPSVGLCAPGPLDSRKGIIHTLPNLQGWENFPLVERLSLLLKQNVCIDNDANAAAYGEWRYGSGKGVRDMVFLTVGTGIGGGVICNGALVEGCGGLAGELGHITLESEGPECGCGNRGCLETLASVTAAIREAKKLLDRGQPSPFLRKHVRPGQKPQGHEILDGAQQGDPLCLQVIEAISRYLGMGIAAYINIFNPEKVVIGGGFSVAFELMEDTLRDEIGKRSFQRQAEMAQLCPAELGNDAGMLGMLARMREAR